MSIRSAYSRYIEFFDEFYGSFDEFLDLENGYDVELEFDERYPHFSDEDRQLMLDAYHSGQQEDEDFNIDDVDDDDDFVEQGWVNSNIDQGGVRHRAKTLMSAAAFRAYNIARHNTERLIKRKKILINLMAVSRYNEMAKRLFQLPPNQEEGNLKIFRRLATLYEHSPIEATRSFLNITPAGLRTTMVRAGITPSRKSVKAVSFAVPRFVAPEIDV